jgi:hypothetical protein
MKFKNQFFASLVVISTLLISFSSCKSDDPKPDDEPNNESELITTFKIELKDSLTNNIQTFYFKDLDGEGGNPPTQLDTIRLRTEAVYLCSVFMLDESKNPVEDITEEIKEEADEHLMVYKVTGANLSIQITDKDSKNLPLGLLTNWKSGSASNGQLMISLKHQPGIKDGSADKGETDVEINFPVIVK